MNNDQIGCSTCRYLSRLPWILRIFYHWNTHMFVCLMQSRITGKLGQEFQVHMSINCIQWFSINDRGGELIPLLLKVLLTYYEVKLVILPGKCYKIVKIVRWNVYYNIICMFNTDCIISTWNCYLEMWSKFILLWYTLKLVNTNLKHLDLTNVPFSNCLNS